MFGHEDVQMSKTEDLGVDGQGGSFYDNTGAIRDVDQNHLLQLLTNVAMEPSTIFHLVFARDERVKVLKGISYAPTRASSADTFAAMRSEPGWESPMSSVETYVALKL